MKLLHIIGTRISLITTIILAFWSVLFYYEILDEINDEVDDALEDYAEMIVVRAVRNEELPTSSSGSNNQFFLKEITPEYAQQAERIKYEDRDVFIKEKDEFEPARVLTYIFENNEGRFFELEVSTPNIDKRDLKESIFWLVIFLFIAILLCITVINILTIRRTMRPMKRLLKWLSGYRVGEDCKIPDNPTNITEFQKLNQVVRESIERTEQAYGKQMLFVGNASHEMQTPLAICNSRLELMMKDENLTESQIEEIVKTRQTLERLSKMNKSLLLLTKIENGQFKDTSTVCIDEVLGSMLPDYQIVYQSKQIVAKTEINGHFYAEMDESLANTLISNLLKNAYVHNIQGGEITIVSDTRSISFLNTGIAEPLEKDLIFERFYYKSSNPNSMGLGLSVAQSICQYYNLSLEYSFRNSRHIFTIKKS